MASFPSSSSGSASGSGGGALGWLWSHRAWIAGAAGLALTAAELAKLSNPKHVADNTKIFSSAAKPAVSASASASASSASPSAASSDVADPLSLFPSLFPSSTVSGLMLHTRSWRVSGPPRCVIFLLHGLGEHCGRYESLAGMLNARLGAHVYALDHQGHGQSGGERAHVERFEHFVQDALAFIQHVQAGEEFRGREPPPCFLFGHSMGGLIASHVMQASYTPTSPALASSAASTPPTPLTPMQQTWRGKLWPWAGCVLSSPALQPNPRDATPMLLSIAGWLSNNLPKLQVVALDTANLSRDPAVVLHYHSDPLVWHGRVRARLAHEMLLAMESMRKQALAGEVAWPMVIVQGDRDTLVHAPGATLLYDAATSSAKHMHTFVGGVHELFNDTHTKEEAGRVVTEWVQQRMDAAAAAEEEHANLL